MSTYSSNKEILINTSDIGSIVYSISSLSSTIPIICKYSKSIDNNKLIDSSIIRDISFVTLGGQNTNVSNIFDYK